MRPDIQHRPTTDRPSQGPWLLAAVIALLSAMTACQAQPAGPTPGASPAAVAPTAGPAAEAALMARIRGEIGDARCSSDAQCRTLPIGHKPCGGPETWWPWSTTAGRADQLKAWTTELSDLQRQRQEASGMMSNCQYIPDPGAVCQAGRCLLRIGSNAR